MALRMRLNETVEELDRLRREHAELDVKLDGQSRELVVARADRASPPFAPSHHVFLILSSSPTQ